MAEHQAHKLTKKDYKTLGLSSLGGTLEFYDFVIYALYIETVIKPLFLPESLSGTFWADIYAWGGFAAGYIARPIGGIIMAHFGDKFGRKKMFTLSVAMMALPTFIIGIMPTYASIGLFAPILLIALRMMQGAAIGGEMPGAWVFIAEHTPKKHYGLGIGTLTSGITGGILLGFLASLAIDQHFAKQEIIDYAWRIPFILGGLFGIISVYLRRYLSETPIFQEMAQRKTLAKDIPVVTVLKKHRLSCLIIAVLTWSLSTTIIVAVLMTPAKILGKMYEYDAIYTSITGIIIALALSVGCVICGVLEDKIKTRAMMIVCWGSLIISSSYFYYSLTLTPSIETIYFNAAMLGLCAGAVASTPIIGARAFPPAIRFSGLSLSYNLTYAILSAITPALTIALLKETPMGAAWYIGFVSILAILVSFLPLAYKGYQEKEYS